MTADDFGLSSGVNRAVEIAWRDGLLTGASLMPGGAAFDEAVAIARRNPTLQVGLHVTLVQGRAVLPPEQLPGLVDEAGNFSAQPVLSGMRYFFDRSLYCQLKRELEAQFRTVCDSGLAISHVDGHLNIHLHPTVFRILTELMPRYGISSFRLSQERLGCNLRYDKKRRIGKALEHIIFSRLCTHARPELDKLKISYAREVKGVLNSGSMTEQYVLNTLDELQDGLTELYFHPGVLPDELISRLMPDYHHAEELAALTSPLIRQHLHKLDIALRNYRGEVTC